MASKAAALALVVRVSVGFGTLPVNAASTLATDPAAASHTETAGLLSVDDDLGRLVRTRGEATISSVARANEALQPVRMFMAQLWTIVAAITCSFGNLAAYGQTNIKRLLAYSTIAHAGYMLLPIPAALALYGYSPDAANRAIGSLAIYMAIYVFMNLTAFAIVALLRNATGSEQIADYAGLVRRHPTIVVCMAIVMFSLVGIPPLAGFVGKFAIFASLMEGYKITGYAFLMVLLLIGGLNTLLSLFYYLRVVRVMAIDPDAERMEPAWSMVSLSGAFIVLITLPLLVLFVYWNGLGRWTAAATQHLF